MSQARNLLDDLAMIGATVEPAGTQLILRAGPAAIPAPLVRRIREAKADLLEILAGDTGAADPIAIEQGGRREVDVCRENCIAQWLDQHPNPSPAGRCAYCGQAEWTGAMVVPFGVMPETHAWLHAECWPAWHERRRGEAKRALLPG
jgi:hypothetical protein